MYVIQKAAKTLLYSFQCKTDKRFTLDIKGKENQVVL